MAFLLHTQNIHTNLAHPADRGAFPLRPRFCRSLLGGDEKALKERHPKSQSREPMATTGCKPERRHSGSPVTSGTLRLRIRPFEAVPVRFAHAPPALGRWRERAPAFKPPAVSPSYLKQKGLSCSCAGPRGGLHPSIFVFVNTAIQIVASRLVWVLNFGWCGKPS